MLWVLTTYHIPPPPLNHTLSSLQISMWQYDYVLMKTFSHLITWLSLSSLNRRPTFLFNCYSMTWSDMKTYLILIANISLVSPAELVIWGHHSGGGLTRNYQVWLRAFTSDLRNTTSGGIGWVGGLRWWWDDLIITPLSLLSNIISVHAPLITS